MKEPHSLSSFSPIWGNENFTPGRADMGFRMWSDKGVKKTCDLYKDDNLMSFEEFVTKDDIPQKHFFKFLQLRSLTRQY